MTTPENEIVVDGSILEGGGQIIRISVALSAILNIPIKISQIRAGRSSPGLRPQHLSGLRLIRDLSNGVLQGDEIGSTEILFRPGKLVGGDHVVNTGTAGSITLIMQAVLPCLLFAASSTKLKIRGGTDVDMAPPFDYYLKVFIPLLKKFGADCHLELVRRGFYPKGNGEIHVSVSPVKKLHHVQLVEAKNLKQVHGSAFVAGTIPLRVAKEMVESAQKNILSRHQVPIKITQCKEPEEKAFGNGTAIVLVGETEDGLYLGGSALGKFKVPAAQVGQAAAEELLDAVKHKVALDQHAQDQVIIFMALASGLSRVLVGPLTLHTQTAIHITSLLTKVEFRVINQGTEPPTFIIECEGLGLVNNHK